MAEADLEVVNCPGNVPTYRGRAGANSSIDVTMVSATLINKIGKWRVEDGLTSSNHNLIHIEITKNQPAAVGGNKYNLRKANWDALRQKYAEQRQLGGGRVNDMAKELVGKLRRAMNAAIPKVGKTKIVNAGPWTERLSYLRVHNSTGRQRWHTQKTYSKLKYAPGKLLWRSVYRRMFGAFLTRLCQRRYTRRLCSPLFGLETDIE